jgi:hypothetical protein
VSFLVRGRDIGLRAGIGLPGLSWVALSWGEPVLPWWGRHEFRDHPHWAGWGGPRMINNVVINRTTVINVGDIHYRNAGLPRAILTVPADKFGRSRFHATPVTDARREDFTPIHGDLPIKPSRLSLTGGASAGLHPPREFATRPVVASRPARERPLPWQTSGPRPLPDQAIPAPRLVKLPARSDQQTNTLPRPPFGPQAGAERKPLPPPPRLGEVRNAPPPAPQASTPGPLPNRKPDSPQRGIERLPAHPASPAPPPALGQGRPAPQAAHPAAPPAATSAPPDGRQVVPPAQRERAERGRPAQLPPADAGKQDAGAQSLPGTPANQTYQRPASGNRRWFSDDRGNSR